MISKPIQLVSLNSFQTTDVLNHNCLDEIQANGDLSLLWVVYDYIYKSYINYDRDWYPCDDSFSSKLPWLLLEKTDRAFI